MEKFVRLLSDFIQQQKDEAQKDLKSAQPAFINDISGSNGVAMSGGVAGELTNWDGTKKNNGWGI